MQYLISTPHNSYCGQELLSYAESSFFYDYCIFTRHHCFVFTQCILIIPRNTCVQESTCKPATNQKLPPLEWHWPPASAWALNSPLTSPRLLRNYRLWAGERGRRVDGNKRNRLNRYFNLISISGFNFY